MSGNLAPESGMNELLDLLQDMVTYANVAGSNKQAFSLHRERTKDLICRKLNIDSIEPGT